ncbi:MJ0042-type zinc finger domain-containing protein [Aurantimonas sp. E1-2-R+4]
MYRVTSDLGLDGGRVRCGICLAGSDRR